MHKYHSDHDSGVMAYSIEGRDIKILFPPDKDGQPFVYTYSYTKPGKNHVEEMKRLAVKGSELATYINKHIREKYDRRDTADDIVITD
ncbi:MAG: hypothetical protein JST50_17805 [Bacteroidetes bacterium]|nr:hypothetical protein [Bacteroidota bacterium]